MITIATATNTFSDSNGGFTEIPITNSNTITTIGGVLRSQADSRRRQFVVTHSLSQAQVIQLEAVINDFSAELTLTLSRPVWGDDSAQSFTVIADTPSITQYTWDGEIIYYVSITYDEVIL